MDTPTMDDNLGFRQAMIDGYPCWVNPSTGRVLPMVRGAEGDEPPADPPPTFTQADLDRIAGRTRDEARRAAENDLATQLGVPVAEAAQIIAEHRAAREAQQTEVQRAEAARVEAERQAAEAASTAAAAEERSANLLALTTAQVNPALISDALRLLDVPAGADVEARTAAVEALKARMPSIFTTAPAPAPAGTPPTPPTPPGSTGGGKSVEERAKDRFAKTQRPLSAA